MIYTRSNEYEEKVTVEAGDYATFTNHDTGTIVQGRITAMMKNPYMDGVDFVKVNGVAVSLRSESWDVTLIDRSRSLSSSLVCMFRLGGRTIWIAPSCIGTEGTSGRAGQTVHFRSLLNETYEAVFSTSPSWDR